MPAATRWPRSRTIFEGWRSLGRWTAWYFAPYIVIWGLVYGDTALCTVLFLVLAVNELHEVLAPYL